MPIETATSLVDTLRQLQLLEPAQLAELSQSAARFADPSALAKELLQRSWLTPYQVNQLLQGKGNELVLGQYVLLERIGEGGMGQVFKAWQRRMNRVVALKVIRKDKLSNPEAVKRFHREIQAAAQLSHPNVVVAYDADQVAGTHFFVMEFVEGTDLAQMVRQSGPLPAVFACDYIRQAALGLQHAHEKGLVHRDIKPSNLLVAWAASRNVRVGAPARAQAESTGRPVVKILDMGLARLEGNDDEDATSQLTQEGSVMGTVDYLAPEQAQNARLADIRSDIYALGCTFYYLLTGRVPFPGGSATEKLLKHRLDVPDAVEKVCPAVPAGVGAVLRKMIAKRPEDRYQTPAEVADALSVPLARIGANLPAANGSPASSDYRAGAVPVAVLVSGNVNAPLATPIPHSDSTQFSTRLVNLVKKPWHRYRWKAVAAGAGAALLFLLLIVLVWPSSRKSRRAVPALPAAEQATEADLKRIKDRLDDYAGDPELVRRFLVSVQRIHATDSQGIQAAELLASLPSPLDRLDPGKISADDREASAQKDGLVAVIGEQRMRHWARGRGVAFSPDGKTVASGAEDGFIRLWDAGTGKQLRSIAHGPPAYWLAYFQNGRRVAALDAYGNLRTWDPGTGREVSTVAGRFLGSTTDRETVATASASNPSHVRLWNFSTGKEKSTFTGHTNQVVAVAFSPDGLLAASGSLDQLIYFWDPATGRARGTPLKGHNSTVMSVHFTADGKFLSSHDYNLNLKVWDTTSGKELSSMLLYGIYGWAPDGRTVVVRATDNTAKLYDVAAQKERKTLRHEQGYIGSVAYSPDGAILATATGSYGDTIKLWETATGAERLAFKGYSGPIGALAWSDTGRKLASIGLDGSVRIWDATTGTELQPLTSRAETYRLANFSRDGQTLALASGGVVHLVDAATGQKRIAAPGHSSVIDHLVFSPDDQTLASGGRDGVAKLWDVLSGQPQATLRHGTIGINGIGFTPDGKIVATGEWYNSKLWDVATGQPRHTFDAPKAGQGSMALAPDGKVLAAGNVDGTVTLLDMGSKKTLRTIPAGKGGIYVSYAPDGRTIIMRGALDGVSKLWDVAGNRERGTLPPAWNVVPSPDGRTATVSSGELGDLRLFDLTTAQVKMPLEGHTRKVEAMVYSPDGQMIASVGHDGRVFVWEPTSRRRRAHEWHLPGPVQSVAFAPDSRHIATVNGNGSVYIFRLGPPALRPAP
ncbi:MAG: protein kinase [Gemmataceae bacterium]|nr:protein kinase [Gemmataceae bacterium]